jgi:hypothetical protein
MALDGKSEVRISKYRRVYPEFDTAPGMAHTAHDLVRNSENPAGKIVRDIIAKGMQYSNKSLV